MASGREPCEGSRHFIENGCMSSDVLSNGPFAFVRDKVNLPMREGENVRKPLATYEGGDLKS